MVKLLLSIQSWRIGTELAVWRLASYFTTYRVVISIVCGYFQKLSYLWQ